MSVVVWKHDCPKQDVYTSSMGINAYTYFFYQFSLLQHKQGQR